MKVTQEEADKVYKLEVVKVLAITAATIRLHLEHLHLNIKLCFCTCAITTGK